VKLRTALFAIQYSCAKSWINCGVEVAAVVGHTFGELTALCVSGILSLLDAIKMAAGRAQIIKKCWGEDDGSMMAVEADLGEVKRLLAESNEGCPGEPLATIACLNGHRSFTLAGTAKAIDVAVEVVATFPPLKSKKLNVIDAFHSTLVEPLMADLKRPSQGLTLNGPTIPLAKAIDSEPIEKLTLTFVTDHLRKPVYFNHAVQRLSKRHPSCIWLEAGPNSTITTMASRERARSRGANDGRLGAAKWLRERETRPRADAG
jgi:acyl transferase domain-containing protein